MFIHIQRIKRNCNNQRNVDCCIRNMALISNQNLNFISAKQILFMSILFRERDEQCRTFCSKEDDDVAEIKSMLEIL